METEKREISVSSANGKRGNFPFPETEKGLIYKNFPFRPFRVWERA
jgi:hypothetical protein